MIMTLTWVEDWLTPMLGPLKARVGSPHPGMYQQGLTPSNSSAEPPFARSLDE